VHSARYPPRKTFGGHLELPAEHGGASVGSRCRGALGEAAFPTIRKPGSSGPRFGVCGANPDEPAVVPSLSRNLPADGRAMARDGD
jgi:hypothetical protein